MRTQSITSKRTEFRFSDDNFKVKKKKHNNIYVQSANT